MRPLYGIYCILACILCGPVCSPQFYVTDYSKGHIYRVNLTNMDTALVSICTGFRQVGDITFDPVANFYGITITGALFQLDTSTHETVLLHQFERSQSYNALVADENGMLYICGTRGILYTYEVQEKRAGRLGTLPFASAGDLTFYRGRLYLAATRNRLIEVNREEP